MCIISKDINKAVKLLKNEEVVAIPTETVYGLAGNIYSNKAINKIFSLKKRPLFNPLIVHIKNESQLQEVASLVPEKAKTLIKHFWPGPLTLILPKTKNISSLITAGKDTVAVRMPNHPVTLALLEKINFPLAAPSANPFSSISPTQPAHVAQYFKKDLKMVLDGGICNKGIESTIVGFKENEVVIYRYGALPLEKIMEVIGPVLVINKNNKTPDAPGMLEKHYAPKTTTIQVDDLQLYLKNTAYKNIGIITFYEEVQHPNILKNIILSTKANLDEAGANLYQAMHELDRLDLDVILIATFPDKGMGKAINDRVQRATKK